ncbi:MAG: hypothetical protein KKG47_03540 [Proteobacteria bacterium]|nr:hypothetical protein [Pseudomonadota bacterium]
MLVVLLFSVFACSGDNKKADEKGADPASVSGKLASGQAENETPPLPPGVFTIKGKVLEVADGGPFTFILVDRGDKQTWATVPPVDVAVGEEVTLRLATIYQNFYSKALDRKFDELIFSSGIEGKEIKMATKRQGNIGGAENVMNRRSMRLHAAAAATKAIGEKK